ncbi:PorP/SprF family type IX secretion system membrane protein [Pontibacter rugosus]|uniref:Type IX secretion system membrane protein PorP/SprF n=1 Tax=Pontibacter rugosus TaxID=1745966 RepID=A0ABW3STL6_9BACT
MKRIIISTLLYFVLLGAATAQQRAQYTQYVTNNYLANPAVGGIESYGDLRVGYRTQWSGLEGAPKTFYASLQGPLNFSSNSPKETKSRYGFSQRNKYKRAVPHHGVGAIVQVDEAGLLKTTNFSASYAYHQPLNKYLTLSSGVTAGLSQFSINAQKALVFDAGDPYLNKLVNASKFDLGLGFWLYSPDFYVGLSGMQLLRNGDDFEPTGTSKNPHLRQQPHLYGTAGIRLSPNKFLSFIPSVMVKVTESTAPSVDVNLRALYAQRIWAGVSYRHQDAMAVMAGLNVSHLLDVGYSYDVATSELNKVSAGTHEVTVGFKLNNRGKIICPTWMW